MAYLTRLTLTNFRNFRGLELELPPGVVVLYGGNAQGKTTLLEAVYLLAIARSFRAENERELVNFAAARNREPALVGGVLDSGDAPVSVYVGYQCVDRPERRGGVVVPPPGASPGIEPAGRPSGLGYAVQKQIRVNRVRKRAADLVGVIGAVLFSAEDIELVQGPPAGRRRYLDILISQGNPLYLKTLQRYYRVVKQRNRLLHLLREGRAGAAELEYWDEELAREGAALTWQRRVALQLLADLGAAHHRELGNPGQEFRLEYHPSVAPGAALAAAETNFRELLAARRPQERAAGRTTIGPQRDDFQLRVDGVDMSRFASRGEARTLALTLRLAEVSYLAAVRAEEPIVLLDDVLSEMDAARRRRVMTKIAGYGQSLITTTDLEPVRAFFGARATYLSVAAGTVTPATNPD